MTDTKFLPLPYPNSRQVLAAIGNRFVVFGSVTLRGALRLGPADVKERLPRVGDERDDVEQRITHSLVVEGFKVRSTAEERKFGDVELVDSEGRLILVEIKAGDRDFGGVNLTRAWQELGQAEEQREIWGFNLEALSLGILWSNREIGPGFVKLPALDVWEFNQDGSVFDRSKVVARVEEWSSRIAALYDEIETWAREEGLIALRDRTIPMSEELMQKFAVPDRDMPILDLLEGDTSVITMKPDGLWLIGFDGAIDVITRHGTMLLVGLPRRPDPSMWTLIDPRDRSQTPWSRETFMSVLGRVPASE